MGIANQEFIAGAGHRTGSIQRPSMPTGVHQRLCNWLSLWKGKIHFCPIIGVSISGHRTKEILLTYEKMSGGNVITGEDRWAFLLPMRARPLNSSSVKYIVHTFASDLQSYVYSNK